MTTLLHECPNCHEPNELTARFCEACGSPLQTAVTASPAQDSSVVFPNCQKCNSSDLEPDGFCNHCGFRNPTKRDHFEQIIHSNFVAISDRGIKHSQNEDCFAIHQLEDRRSILVVCDGVSSSTNPGAASLNASQTACKTIQQALESGSTAQDALQSGIQQAQNAVTQLAATNPGEAPSSTIVAAIVSPIGLSKISMNEDLISREPEIDEQTIKTRKTIKQNINDSTEIESHHIEVTIGWLGDSRAYWLAPTLEKSKQLSQDHSWCEEMVSTGQMDREEAERSIQAHAITRWLGADADEDMKPSISTFILDSPGQLLLCSDGLWNYASEISQIQPIFPSDQDTLTTARKSIEFALKSGGQDNITIALLNLAIPPE